MGDPRRRVVVERRRLLAAQRRHDAGEHDRQAVAAGVDDARLAQRGQQLGAALDRVLPASTALSSARRDRAVLLGRVGLGAEARVLGGVGDVACDPVGHLAGDRQHRPLGRVRAPTRTPGRRRSPAPRRSASRRSAGRAGRRAPRRRRGSAARGSRPSCRARPSSAARATDCTISSRPISSIVRSPSAPCSWSSSSSTARSVSAMLSPVSPSATGNTLRSLTSSRRDSRWASAPATAARKRTRLVSVTRTRVSASGGRGRCPGGSRAGRACAVEGSESLRHLAGFQAAGAHVHAPRRGADHDPDLLQVRDRSAAWSRPSSGCGSDRTQGPSRSCGIPWPCRAV